MSPGSPELSQYQPQLLEEAEALLGTQFFPGNTILTAENQDPEAFGYKSVVYTRCLRMFAETRERDRTQAAARPNYTSRKWARQWHVTTKKLAETALRHESEIEFLSRQLAMANNASSYLNEHWQTMQEGLFEDQHPYILDMIDSLQKPPRTIHYEDTEGNNTTTEVHGITSVAPTGSGKTHLLMTAAEIFSIGKPIENTDHGERPARMLHIAPSRDLVAQTAADLRQRFPDLSVGIMSSDGQQPDADIVVSTIEMFNGFFYDGHMQGRPVDLITIDEAHHLLEPQFKRTFLEQWHGHTLLYTATPAYGSERDVRDIIPYTLDHSDIFTLMENERLNDAQVFTFLIDEQVYRDLLHRYNVTPTYAQHEAIIYKVIHELVREFTMPLLAQGRRGIAFCKEGNQAYYSRQLAEMFDGQTLPDGRLVNAVSMNSYANNQTTVLREYHQGKIDLITTVDTGRQGLNAAFDFVLLINNTQSMLRGTQIVGRGTRRSVEFPVTVYAQFINAVNGHYRQEMGQLFLIEEVFGSDLIRQGETHAGVHGDRQQDTDNGVDISEFSELIQDLLARIDRQPISEMLVGGNYGRESVEGLRSLDEVLQDCDVSETAAKQRLRAAGHIWKGRYERIEGVVRPVQYVTPEAEAFLRALYPKEGHQTMRISDIARSLGVSHSFVRDKLLEEEWASATEQPYRNESGDVYQTNTWSASQAAEIVERLREVAPAKVPAHIVPLNNAMGGRLIRNYHRSRVNVWSALSEAGFSTGKMTIRGQKKPTRTISWQALAFLQREMGVPRGKDVIIIDPDRLPSGPDDQDQEKIKYAQEIQRQFIALDKLQTYDFDDAEQ